jgi:hypothetical protein
MCAALMVALIQRLYEVERAGGGAVRGRVA